MNPVNTPPPPEKGGLGCLGKGCLTGVGLVIFLAIAFVGGTYWAVHHLRQKYSASEPLTLPEVSESDLVASEPTAVPVPAAPASAPTAPTAPPQAPVPIQKRWKTFEKAKNRNENANIVLTASEINALLSANNKTRGKGFVWIENNLGHIRVSIPLNKVYLMEGRYLTGEATVEPSPDGNPMSARITNIVINGEPVPDSVLDRRLFGWSSMRMQINKWLSDERITSFRIEDNRVIGQKQGGGSF
ncbi:MAG TPA: hypothetical protein VGD41_16115 [Pyrinomonadaceae bacterium]